MSDKEKVAFVSNSFHKKTKSVEFLINYLKEYFEVETVYDEEWETGEKIQWENFDNKYKAVIILQMFPTKEDFEKIPNKNIIFFPMYDQSYRWSFKDWIICKNVKIISFSSKLYKKLRKWGFNCIYLQYFIEPKEFTPGAKEKVFFWQRLTKINIKIIEKIFKNEKVKIHIHKIVDPGQNFIQPSKEAENKFEITYSEWFDTKEELWDVIKSSGIFIAPRYKEGIGMSFLEAMAQGKAIISNKDSTMNEYIKNGETGYLCNFKYPRSIKLKNIEQVQRNTYEMVQKGYKKWLKDREQIIESIKSEPIEVQLKLWTRIFRPFLLINRKDIIKCKFGSNATLVLFNKKIF